MTKSFLYRLFGSGKIPEQLLAQLKGEGIVLLDEGVKGTVTYRNFRAPGRYSNWRRQWYPASIALTGVRLVATRYGHQTIDVPLTDERLGRMRFALEESGALLVSFDASLFHADWSGTLEYRFRTPLAQAFMDKLPRAVVTAA